MLFRGFTDPSGTDWAEICSFIVLSSSVTADKLSSEKSQSESGGVCRNKFTVSTDDTRSAGVFVYLCIFM